MALKYVWFSSSLRTTSARAITHAALKQDTPDSPIVRAERHHLRNWLAFNLPVQWDKRVMRVEHDDEGVSVYFKDGSSAKGDILIGADGINSMSRSSILDIRSVFWLRESQSNYPTC